MEEVEGIVQKVAAQKEAWTKVSFQQKLKYLLKIQKILEAENDNFGIACTKVRTCDQIPQMNGMGYLIGCGFAGTVLRGMIELYTSLAKTGKPPTAGYTTRKRKDHVIVNFPPKGVDKMMKVPPGELYLKAGQELEQDMSILNPSEGKLTAVLGPGNYEAPLEPLHKLFLENSVVVFKPHPVNGSVTAPFFKKFFAEMIEAGFIGILSGIEPEVASTLIHNPLVDQVMMTGGAATYDRIVWGGSNEEIEENKKKGEKKMNKPFHAELGACSPYVFVPGKWSLEDLKHNVEVLVAFKSGNGGAICASPQLVLIDKDWPLKDAFYTELKNFFKTLYRVPAYYPNTKERSAKFLNHYKQQENVTIETFSPQSPQPNDAEWFLFEKAPLGSLAFKEECFGTILCVHEVDTKNDPVAFMKEATRVCNQEIYGSLSMTIIIDPQTEKEHKEVLEDMIADLEWGTVAVNDWTLHPAMRPHLVWGGFPGKHTPENIQSGIGQVGNSFFFKNIQKSVMRGQWVSPAHQKMGRKDSSKVFSKVGSLMILPKTSKVFSLIWTAATN